MKRVVTALLLLITSVALADVPQTRPEATFTSGSPRTTNNDDSCDIALQPAATLLVPYFEVNVNARGHSTLLSITNTSNMPQIARITIWSDWSFPVLNFNVFLTGYDVQSLDLFDVLGRGVIAPPSGTNNQVAVGSRSLSNLTGNPNFLPTASENCAPNRQPTQIPAFILFDVQQGLMNGSYSLCGNAKIGGNHGTVATGYVTIDVVGTCSGNLPNDPVYFANEILYDNVLIGDYTYIRIPQAASNPMVHIRAVPEGGQVGSNPGTNLRDTFYDRYTTAAASRQDRRQPLPSTFAARFVQGGSFSFATELAIWREGVTTINTACSSYVNNSAMAVAELVRFDERENPTTLGSPSSLAESSSSLTSLSIFPPMPSGDVGGWMYVNLNNNAPTGTYHRDRASQNWVTVRMSANNGEYHSTFDAPALGNGCSPAQGITGVLTNPIGPAANTTP